jgi:hypothetical protein
LKTWAGRALRITAVGLSLEEIVAMTPSTLSPPANPTNNISSLQPSLTELVSGILKDAQTLMSQQVQMLRAEFNEDLRRTREGARYMGLGATLGAVGGLFLAVGLVQLLIYLAPALPPWASWFIVGGLLLAGGVIALMVGKRLFETYFPVPTKSINALQENLSWIANPPK